MYNPSRGGVRGGADQFTWESVKNDKHRENYLGHSLMAPVGRWQKGKDLSWYAKERKDANEKEKYEKSQLASIKREEEEAMLIALGHNIVRKTQQLSKEDIREVLKRNTGESADHNFERVNGVGASSQRVALLSGLGKNPKQNMEGVTFEAYRERAPEPQDRNEKRNDSSSEERRKRSKKKSKKHKKEKKHKKHHKETYDTDSPDDTPKHRTKQMRSDSDSDNRKSSRPKTHKKSKHRHRDHSSDEGRDKFSSYSRQVDHKRHKHQRDSVKRQRHDSSESD